MLETIKKLFGLTSKNFIYLLILSVLFFNNSLRSEEAEKKFVGFIDALEGTANKGDSDDPIKLSEFDQIFENEK